MLLKQEELDAAHVMIDLETLGTKNDAVIVSIGAHKFSFLNDSRPYEPFYTAIDIEQPSLGMYSIDPSTVVWWMRQSKEAQVVFNDAQSLPLYKALGYFSDWLATLGKDVRVWGNGANFDNVILRNAFEQEGLKAPWKYAHDRCFRTMKAMLPKVDVVRKGTHHNALDDAIYQAEYLVEAIKASK